ncbi:DUF4352 domain-containing protein [Gordonia sp. (in: high G+C Gram-positive bacteria)]|uniref:DUF4352 domain-containing protein n=1 Tax=Gordonia sp. (in: high G+C Gram-positive bacteria) TaxID=84139 RepID=UPI0016938223|nr:DUF4352 domain-containing protein [Gordonia sp. (in: high G+C Gram-positive bacteria)]NLG47034.1 DUF4352 domain-containing protein [Gordonia sp. (in: high G+C Gram-positive bacteria)]
MFSFRKAAIAAVAVLALGATIASGEEDKAEKVGADGSSQEQSEFNVGDTVKLGDWQVKVYGVEDPYVSSNEFMAPSPGNRHVVVDAEVTNGSDKPQVVSSVMCFELRDDTNRSYDIAITDGGKSLDGEIAAGAARRGNLAYEVPEAAKNLQLQFKCDLLGSGSAMINLS